MWAAVRTLDDSALVAERIVERARVNGKDVVAERFGERARQARRHAGQIRAMLLEPVPSLRGSKPG